MESVKKLLQHIQTLHDGSPHPSPITLIAVSKKHTTKSIEKVYQEGLRHFGENYLQEAIPKIKALPSELIWHYIGKIQSNKAKMIAEHFHWVHTITREKEAIALHQAAESLQKALQICIQVNISGETQKNGVMPEEAMALAQCIKELGHLKLRGLMGMAAQGPEEQVKASFAKLRLLKESIEGLDTLSMGMSQDYPWAIEEGATMLRLGTVIFGRRQQT